MTAIVNLSGGAPWGFKMAGGTDFKQPLSVSRVNGGSKAERAGMPEGFLITRINGIDTCQLTHRAATDLIKNSGFTVVLELSKPKLRSESSPQAYSPLPSPASSVSSGSSNIMEGNKFDLYRPSAKPYSSPASSTGRRSPDGSSVIQSPTFQKVYEGKPVKTASFMSKPKVEAPKEIKFSPAIAQMIREEEEEKERMKRQQQNAPAADERASPEHVDNGVSRGAAHQTIGKFLGNVAVNSRARQPPTNKNEPDFVKPLIDMCKPLGEPVVLKVELNDCQPPPSVHWYHEKKPQHESAEKDIKILNNGTIHTLVLGELTKEQVGSYTCTIMNRHGSKSSKCRVTIEHDKTKHSPRPAYMNAPPAFPKNGASSSTSSGAAPERTAAKQVLITSSNVGLFNDTNRKQAYHNQVVKPAQKQAMGEESEVLKLLRLEEKNAAPKTSNSAHKSRTMRYLEEAYVEPDSEDL